MRAVVSVKTTLRIIQSTCVQHLSVAMSTAAAKGGSQGEGGFGVGDLKAQEPLGQFRIWLQEAVDQLGRVEAYAMTLATATREGHPSARMMRLQRVDDKGILFATETTSRKGKELTENPHCSLVFYWAPMLRSVRIEGTVEILPREELQTCFSKFPRVYQVKCHLPRTPTVPLAPDHEDLAKKIQELMTKFGDESKPVPAPDFWDCYRVVPTAVEFYQGRADLSTDRLLFRKLRSADEVLDLKVTMKMQDGWVLERL